MGESYDGTTCVVTGANGFVGSHLVRTLVGAGASTRALVRTTSDLSLLDGVDAELVYGDVTDRASLDAAFDQADYIFHVAGIVKALKNETYDWVNNQGCRNVCESTLAVAGGAKRVIDVSSLAAAGPSTVGEPRIESDEEAPVSVYGKSKLAGEAVCRAYMDRLPISIARPPFVYGPSDSASFEIYEALTKHLKVIITGGPRYYSFVYVKDLCDGLLAVGANERAVNDTFYLTSPEVMTYKNFQNAVLETLDTWAIHLPMPAFLMPLMGRMADWIARRRKKAAVFSRQKVAEALPKAWVCSPAKAEEKLGFTTKVLIPDGLRTQTDWYRENGWI